MKNPKWAIPTNDMNEDELNFAIAAECILSMKRKIKGFTKEQHIGCFKTKYQDQAAKDWDEVEAKLKGKQ